MTDKDVKEENTCQIPDPSKIPSEDILDEQVDFFKAMADPTRLSILYLLEDSEMCSCKIQMALDKAQPTISHHMNVLKKANLIKGTKIGTWTYYKLANPDLIKIILKIKAKE